MQQGLWEQAPCQPPWDLQYWQGGYEELRR